MRSSWHPLELLTTATTSCREATVVNPSARAGEPQLLGSTRMHLAEEADVDPKRWAPEKPRGTVDGPSDWKGWAKHAQYSSDENLGPF